jgi:hypothetical protein
MVKFITVPLKIYLNAASTSWIKPESMVQADEKAHAKPHSSACRLWQHRRLLNVKPVRLRRILLAALVCF